MDVHSFESGCIGLHTCTSPPPLRFPSALEMSLGLRPRDISRASGNLLVVGDVQPNGHTCLLSAMYGYNTIHMDATLATYSYLLFVSLFTLRIMNILHSNVREAMSNPCPLTSLFLQPEEEDDEEERTEFTVEHLGPVDEPR